MSSELLAKLSAHSILEQNGKILLIKRLGGYHNGLFALPAGHIEPGETPPIAAAREALEEINVNINPKNLIPVHTLYVLKDQPHHPYINFYFLCKDWIGEPKILEPEKSSSLAWYEKTHLPIVEMVPYLPQVLSCIFQNIHYSEYQIAD